MKHSKYFAPQEFKRCSPSCSIEDMDQNFLNTLDAIRALAGIPLVLNCAYRSKEYDIKKGRSGNSAHTKGLAVDIKCNSSATRYKIMKAADSLGITRFGIGNSFLHIDADKSLPQNVIWHYY